MGPPGTWGGHVLQGGAVSEGLALFALRHRHALEQRATHVVEAPEDGHVLCSALLQFFVVIAAVWLKLWTRYTMHGRDKERELRQVGTCAPFVRFSLSPRECGRTAS